MKSTFLLYICNKIEEKEGMEKVVIDHVEETVIDLNEESMRQAHAELHLKRVVAILLENDEMGIQKAKDLGMHFEKPVVYKTHEALLFVRSFYE